MHRVFMFWAMVTCLLLPAGSQAAADALSKIKANHSITITYAENAFPFAHTAEDGQPAGYSIDICKRIVTGLAAQLGVASIAIDWVPGNTPGRLEMIANGEADLDCGTTSVTLSRQESVDFSNEIFLEMGGILVLSSSDIEGIDDLGGKKIAVVPGTTTEKRLQGALNQRLLQATLVAIQDGSKGIPGLDEGIVDAYAGDRLVLIGHVSAAADPSRYSLLADQFSIDPYALAMPRGDSDFRLAVNRGLAQIYSSGAIEKIFERWFGSETKPTSLLRAVYLLNALQD